jgi:hypothetical protein
MSGKDKKNLFGCIHSHLIPFGDPYLILTTNFGFLNSCLGLQPNTLRITCEWARRNKPDSSVMIIHSTDVRNSSAETYYLNTAFLYIVSWRAFLITTTTAFG